jgi:hypothetical protein
MDDEPLPESEAVSHGYTYPEAEAHKRLLSSGKRINPAPSPSLADLRTSVTLNIPSTTGITSQGNAYPDLLQIVSRQTVCQGKCVHRFSWSHPSKPDLYGTSRKRQTQVSPVIFTS